MSDSPELTLYDLVLSFPAGSLWSEDKLPEGLFLGSDVNYRPNLYTQTSKYADCKLQNI